MLGTLGLPAWTVMPFVLAGYAQSVGGANCTPGSFFTKETAACGSNVQELKDLKSPFQSSMHHHPHFQSSCGFSKAAIFAVELSAGSSISIGATDTDVDFPKYGSAELRWGGHCPGHDRVICELSSQTKTSWTNNKDQAQSVFFIFDQTEAWDDDAPVNQNFTLTWEISGTASLTPTFCKQCPVGKYQPMTAAGSCIGCPSGATTAASGSSHLAD
jgi:hypothetical protein